MVTAEAANLLGPETLLGAASAATILATWIAVMIKGLLITKSSHDAGLAQQDELVGAHKERADHAEARLAVLVEMIEHTIVPALAEVAGHMQRSGEAMHRVAAIEERRDIIRHERERVARGHEDPYAD